METDNPTAEPADRSLAVPMKQEASAREMASAMSHSSTEHSHGPSLHNNNSNIGQDRPSSDIWTSAISRLQAQVSYNTGMLDSHRRQFADIEVAVGRLQQQMNEIVHALGDVQRDLRTRPAAVEKQPRQDSGEIEVLATQLQRFTNRINEIDGLNMQVDLIKNRMKRLEDGAISTPSQHRPPTTSHRETSFHEGLRDSSHGPPPLPSQQQHSSQALQQQQHGPLPPIRTNSMASPGNGRPPNFPPSALQAPDLRSFPGDQSAAKPPSASVFRSGETLPPPSALSSWRPAEPSQGPAASPANAMPGMRTNAMDVEPHDAQHGPGGWAPVNVGQAVKRPPEDRSSPYDSPSADASKRPRLAPLMPNAIPRSNYGDDNLAPMAPAFAPVVPPPSEVPFHPRSRAPSDGSQSQSQTGSTPAPLATQHNFRFITSTQQTDPQEQWRADSERSSQGGSGGTRGGRGKGSRGGRARGRGRGGPNGPGNHHDVQELGTPEYERPELSAQQVPHSAFYNTTMLPQSPMSAVRGPFAGPPSEKQPDYPATPQPSAYDAQAGISDAPGSGGKKTRTKPIRNAEGILIRKDGRPDMRSVSSANNLRKVHAKKEAERAGEPDGEAAHTPESSMAGPNDHLEDGEGVTRSGTPTSAAARDLQDEGLDGHETQEKHKDLVHQVLTSNHGVARAEERSSASPHPPAMKNEGGEQKTGDGQAAAGDSNMVETTSQREQEQDAENLAAEGNSTDQQRPAATA